MSSRLARTSAIAVVALGSTLLVLPSFSAAGNEVKAPRLHDIQGNTRISPLAGKEVTDVPGVVTAVRDFGKARGFWLQDPKPDDDPATSEGIFVYTGEKSPDVKVEDSVSVSGEVSEFYPGGEDAGGQSVTQLTGAETTVKSKGERLPKAAGLNADRVPEAYAPEGGDGGDIEKLKLRPEKFALDMYESLEGMRTQLKNAPVTGPTTEFGELWVTADPDENPTPRGGTLYGAYDQQNGARVKVSSLLPLKENPFPKANVGDALSGTTAGPLDYDNFGGYAVRATTMGELKDNKLKREKTRKQRKSELAVATYNVENLSPASRGRQVRPARRGTGDEPLLARRHRPRRGAGQLGPGRRRHRRRGQDPRPADRRDREGRRPRLRVAPDQPRGQGGRRPARRQHPGRLPLQPGARQVRRPQGRRRDHRGEGGGRRRQGEAVRQPGTCHSWGRRVGGDPQAAGRRVHLPGRQVFVVANHFSSKGGDAPMEGRVQPPERASEKQRVEQAKVVNSFAKEVQSVDPKAAVIAAGDLNDFPFSPSLDALRAGKALTSPMEKLPADEHYGYVFNGNSQVLDHALTSKGAGKVEYDIVHINAEFHDQASDHDPTVIRINR